MMAQLMLDVTTIVTEIVKWAGQIVDFIVANPLILAFCAISIFGCAVILVKSWIHR